MSDVTRICEWSPICRACWWDEGARPEAGAWFTGRNETPERTWETRCRVVAADAEIDSRRAAAQSGIPATLAAIKKAAEAGT